MDFVYRSAQVEIENHPNAYSGVLFESWFQTIPCLSSIPSIRNNSPEINITFMSKEIDAISNTWLNIFIPMGN